MWKIVEQFLILIQFMTRIPVFVKTEYSNEKLGKSIKFFPLVGLAIGLILYYSSTILVKFSKNNLINALIVIVIELMVVGIIHIDGLCDTFDGLFSYREKEKMLEIMKDSRLGSNGALALILYFLIKFILLFSLTIESREGAIYVIMTYPVVSRFCSVVSCAFSPYARGSGMGKTFVDNTKTCGLIVATTITLLYTIGMLFMPFILFANYSLPMGFMIRSVLIIAIIVGLLALFAFAFSKLIERKIGGITGDTLGALLEISSLVYIFLFLVIPTFFMG